MTFAWPLLLYLAGVAFVTAILHSVGGFAGALMMAIAIAPVVGIKAAVPIVATAMVVSHGSRAWLLRGAVDWQAFKTIYVVAFPCILIGIYLYVELSEAIVALFLGLMLLVTVPLRRVLAGRSIQMPRAGLAVIAVPYGLLSGVGFGVGMILGPFLLGAGITGEVLVATIALQGFILNVVKTIAFGASPLLTREFLLIGLSLGLCTFPGHWIGRMLLRRTPIRVHAVILEVFMLIGALYFVYRGISALA